MPLRLRLTLLYVVLLALALVILGVVVYLIAGRRIYASVDDGLAVSSAAVLQALEPIDLPLTEADIANHRLQLNDEASTRALFQIRDPEGNPLYSSLQPASRGLPPPELVIPGEEQLFTHEVEGKRLRILYQPIVRGGDLFGSVEVGQSLREADNALAEIRNAFIIGGVAVLVLTSVSAYALAGRALDPVRQVSDLARHIEQTADFSRRLATPRSSGEVKELTATFNSMIERIEHTLEAQQAFLADSSHELRRPLTVIRTNVDILNDASLLTEERALCLQEMRSEAEAMSILLSDLLLLSREEGQAITRTPTDLSALCERVIARLRAQDNGHQVNDDVEAGLHIMGDSERLEQALWNLLENASRYTPDGGRICFRLRRAGGFARIDVEDTGIGITAEDLPHIFDRFYRGNNARAARVDGTGLGLPIVKYLAEAHGGAVAVQSQPGRGTTFTVVLPAITEALP